MSLAVFISRVRAFFRTAELDRDFAQEIDAHVAMLTEDYVQNGMRRDAAERAARRRIGAAGSLAARHRDARGLPTLDDLWQDVRFALRLTFKERAFTAAAVAALAMGVGANAFGFSVIHAAFFRGLPFEAPDRLVRVGWNTGPRSLGSLSYEQFDEWRAARSVELSAVLETQANISDDRGAPEQVRAAWVSANLFRVLGQPLLLGRDFTRDEDRPGRVPVVIVGHRVWRDRFGSDAAVLGRTLLINGQAAAIIGVMPEGMRFADNAEIWTPFVPQLSAVREGARPVEFDVYGRLRDGVSHDEARAELTAIAQRSVTRALVDPARTSARVEPPGIGGTVRTIFPTVMAVGAFVLLIACANVANLLLSRTPYRAREIALRIALGATRGRVVRQLLLESLVLALLGGVAGLLLAAGAATAFETALQDSGKPFWLIFRTDPAVVAYVAALSALTCVTFGLAPALQASAIRSQDVLKDGGRSGTEGPRIRWFSGALVVVQLSLTIVLLGGSGLVIRGFLTLYSLDPGIRTQSLSVMQLELLGERYDSPKARWAFSEQMKTRLAAVAGIESTAMTTAVPPFDGGERLVEIDEPGSTPGARFASTVTISPEFFTTVERPVLRGRDFGERDGLPGAETVVVNEEFVERFFSGADAIGRRMRFTTRDRRPEQNNEVWRTIVGISAPIRHGSRQDAYRGAVVYLPYRQDAPATVSLIVRSQLPLATLADTVRREVQAEDANLPILRAETLAQAIAADRWAHRIFGGLFAMLAVASLVLSGVGLYAVMAYGVSRRRQEIGIRMAVGAGHAQVSWMIVRRGLLQLAIGLPFGLIGALALGVVLESLLVELSPADPVTLAGVVLVSTLVALAACVVPARRATRLDPVAALRE